MESTGNNTTLAEVNAYERSYKTPAFVFLGLLTVIGLIGNSFVIYVYGFRIRKKKVQHFITLLAVYDILCCLLGLPLKMLELWMPVTYPSGGLCKVENFVICFVCVASALTLQIISIDRYKKVCRSTKPQMTLVHVKISSVVITLVSLGFGILAAFVYDRMPEESNGMEFCICTMDQKALVTQIYFMALMVVMVLNLVSLLVFYCLVWRTARKHLAELPTPTMRYQGTMSRCTSQIGQAANRPQKTNTTRILVLISLLFVISFVPCLILSIIVGNLFQRKDFSWSVKVIFELVYATWALNSSMNPIIYGFCNRNFTRHIRSVFTRFGVFQRYHRSVTSGDTSGDTS